MSKTLTLIFVVLVFILGGLLYINNPEPVKYQNPKEVVCPTDTQICPDGSYAKRAGPQCQFTACPIPKDAFMEDGTAETSTSTSTSTPSVR